MAAGQGDRSGDGRGALSKAGLWLALFGLGSSLGVVFLALPVFGAIIWFQSEPVIAGLHATSGLAAVGLALFVAVRPRTLKTLAHPVVLLPLALALWSVLAGLAQRHPMLGWFGSIEAEEGVLWYLDAAVLGATAILAGRIKGARPTLAACAGFVAVIVAIMTWRHETGLTHEMAPFYFPDYLAFFGLFVIPAGIGLLRLGRPDRIRTALVAGVGVAIVSISKNWAAYGLIFAGGPVIWAIATYLPARIQARRALAVAGAALVPLAMTALLALPIYEGLAKEEGLVGRLANSVLSRHRLMDIVVEATKADPLILLFGSGWGSFSDLLAIHIPMKWAILRDFFGDLPQGKEWDAVLRVDFHSHDFILEALLGGGVIGVALSLAIVATLPYWSRRRYFPLAAATAVATGGLLAFWFQFPVTLPFMALAWGALAKPMAWKVRLDPALPRVAGGGLFALGLMLIYFGVTAAMVARQAFFFQPPMAAPLHESGRRQACPALLDDQGRGGLHLAHRLKTYSAFMASKAGKEGEVPDDFFHRLRGIICASEEAIDRGARFRLLVTSLLARSDLAFAPPDRRLDPVTAEFLSNWERRLTQALAIAPRRTDLAAPYLLWLLKEGKEATLRGWANRLFVRDPEDPVGLWFSGIALLGDASRAPLGIGRMKKALSLGIERFIPVEESIKEELSR